MDRGLTAASSSDDSSLLLRIAAGDRQAFARLFERHAGRLLAIAKRIVRRADLAEEVVQDTFVAIWRRAAQFDPARGNATAWLNVAVRNRALNLIRDDARVDYVDTDTLADLGDRYADAVAAFDQLPEADALRRCLGLLDGNRREAILLSYVVGMNHGEVSRQLNAPLGTVKAWIRRGTAALQECLS